MERRISFARLTRFNSVLSIVILSLVLLASLPSYAVTINEFGVNIGPLGIVAGPDGNIWVTESTANKIGLLTPVPTFNEFTIPTSNSEPYGITAGPDGNLWFVEQAGNKIGRITPAGVVTEFKIPSASSYPNFITVGPDGNLWFTEYIGNKIGRITPAGVITEFTVLTADSAPLFITAGPDGNLWFTEWNQNKIGRITPAGVITEFTIPTGGSLPYGITAGPDGNLWFTEMNASKIGRITPAGVITEFTIRFAGSAPRFITAGPDGNLWFTESGDNMVGRITPAGGFTEFIIPTSNGEPWGITAGSDGNIWFTEVNANKIGQLLLAGVPWAPVVTTTSPTQISFSQAIGGGTVTSDGGATVTFRGVCYGTSANPVFGGTCTSDGTGTGSFVSSITGLTANTRYHVRAYAINSAGQSYGTDVPFTTLAVMAPTVSTTAISNVTNTSATGGGTVTSDGGATVTFRGVCYGTSANPAFGGTCTSDGTGTGSFVSSITNLSPGQLYHMQAYATNSVGTAYGSDVTFTTLAVMPMVTTTPITGITNTSATGGGTVTSNGGATLTAEGVCYGTSANPALGGACTNDGTVTGSYASSITSLSPGQLYHVRAYATNLVGTAYGSDLTFTALTVAAPTVTTAAITGITSRGATSGGTVTADGGAAVSSRGVCWATTANPAVGGSCTTNGSGTGTFVSAITGLTLGQLYHVRAYATNSVGTSYGADVQFTASAGLSKIGVFRGGAWYMDLPGTYTWVACGTDGCYSFGMAGDIPVMGDWDGTGIMRIGVFRNGSWYLDMNANDVWDGSDVSIPFGAPGDIPVVGNWNGSADGKTKIGIFRNGTWYLDYAGTYATTRTWAGCGAPADPTKAACIPYGIGSDVPVVGNWNGSADGKSNIGIFRNGTWYLDYAGTCATSGLWAGCGAPADPTKAACIPYGISSDVPVVGNWNGSADGKSKIGIFRNGMWYLDYPGTYEATGVWTGCGAPTDPTKEVCAAWGAPGDIPVILQ